MNDLYQRQNNTKTTRKSWPQMKQLSTQVFADNGMIYTPVLDVRKILHSSGRAKDPSMTETRATFTMTDSTTTSVHKSPSHYDLQLTAAREFIAPSYHLHGRKFLPTLTSPTQKPTTFPTNPTESSSGRMKSSSTHNKRINYQQNESHTTNYQERNTAKTVQRHVRPTAAPRSNTPRRSSNTLPNKIELELRQSNDTLFSSMQQVKTPLPSTNASAFRERLSDFLRTSRSG